jgi:hypothetical protein
MYLGGHSLDSSWRGEERKRADALTAWNPAAGKFLFRFTEPDRPRKDDRRENFGWRVVALAISPDGRLVAAADEVFTYDGVWLYEAVSGRPLKKLVGHEGTVTDLVFTPDGRRLVSASTDQTGLVWDVTLPALAPGRGGEPAGKGVTDAWDRLANSDPVRGYTGIAALAAAPGEAVPLLREKLRPCPVPTAAELDVVVARLGAPGFDDREKAVAELERFGPAVAAAAAARLAAAESPEVRARLGRFLAAYGGPHASPYELRSVRGVAALEAIGTPAAKDVLADLARGNPADVLTREAVAALRRVGIR